MEIEDITKLQLADLKTDHPLVELLTWIKLNYRIDEDGYYTPIGAIPGIVHAEQVVMYEFIKYKKSTLTLNNQQVGMNIYAQLGDKVIVTDYSKDQGHRHDSEKIAKYLKVGVPYEVHHTIVHDWHTDVVLMCMPEIRFNSVNFEDYKEK